MIRFGIVGVALLGSVGCGQGADAGAGRDGQLVLSADGYHEFYLGAAVWDDVESTGTFTPEVTDWFTVIRVPDALIPTGADSPVTVSLCASNGVTVYDHVYVGPEKAIANRPNPPDPFLTTTDEGEMIAQYAAGMEGLYGIAQVRSTEEGLLLAAVGIEVIVRYPNGNARDGGFLAGFIEPDAELDDPLLENHDNAIKGCDAPPL